MNLASHLVQGISVPVPDDEDDDEEDDDVADDAELSVLGNLGLCQRR